MAYCLFIYDKNPKQMSGNAHKHNKAHMTSPHLLSYWLVTNQSISSKIGNKIKWAILTTSIQHSVGSSQPEQTDKKHK